VAGRSTRSLAVNVTFPELQPLVAKVAPLEKSADAADIWQFVSGLANSAVTPTMAQSACDKIIVMCHPKAWGDRFVRGYDEPWTKWHTFLEELSELANTCGQRIYDHHGKGARVDG
jgi:hypothetical protein